MWPTSWHQGIFFTSRSHKPDWCFGILKQHFKRSKVGYLDDIVRVVNDSATPNVAQLVGTQQGEVIVPMYDWSDYFEDKTVKTSLKGIIQMHHFHFSRSHLGKVKVQNSTTDKWKLLTYSKILPGCHRISLGKWYHSNCHSNDSGIFTIRSGNFVLRTAEIWCAQSH